MIVSLHRAANAMPEPFVDHTGTLRDARTGRPINGYATEDSESGDEEEALSEYPSFKTNCHRELIFHSFFFVAGYSFFDSGEVELLGRRKSRPSLYNAGKVIPMAEY